MRNPKLALLLVLPMAVAAARGQVQVSADAFPISPAAPVLPVLPRAASPLAGSAFVLRTDEPIHAELRAWAQAAGWEFIWHPPVSWRTLRATSFAHQDVTAAVTEVIDILRDEGRPVRLRIAEGNRVMEVLSTEVRND